MNNDAKCLLAGIYDYSKLIVLIAKKDPLDGDKKKEV